MRIIKSIDDAKTMEGEEIGLSDWVVVDQQISIESISLRKPQLIISGFMSIPSALPKKCRTARRLRMAT